jgi:hypothetical protein
MPKGRESAFNTVKSKDGSKTVVRKDSPRGKRFEKDRFKATKDLTRMDPKMTGKQKSTAAKRVAADMARYDAVVKNAGNKARKLQDSIFPKDKK